MTESQERAATIRRLLTEKLDATHVEDLDASADHAGHVGAREGGHYGVVVVSPRFSGLSRVAAQRLVYEAVADLMDGIHALQMRTFTPESWDAATAEAR